MVVALAKRGKGDFHEDRLMCLHKLDDSIDLL
jgi:hypothetical protein